MLILETPSFFITIILCGLIPVTSASFIINEVHTAWGNTPSSAEPNQQWIELRGNNVKNRCLQRAAANSKVTEASGDSITQIKPPLAAGPHFAPSQRRQSAPASSSSASKNNTSNNHQNWLAILGNSVMALPPYDTVPSTSALNTYSFFAIPILKPMLRNRSSRQQRSPSTCIVVKLVIWNGDTLRAHTVVDLTGVDEVNYLVIGAPAAARQIYNPAWHMPWSSETVTSISNGHDFNGFLSTFWSYESAVILYEGTESEVADLRVSKPYGAVKNLLRKAVDYAFFSLQRKATMKLRKVFENEVKRFVALPLFPLLNDRVNSYNLCPKSSTDYGYSFRTEFWKVSAATPFSANECERRIAFTSSQETAAIIAAEPEMPLIAGSLMVNQQCDQNAETASATDLQVFLLRDDSRQKGAGECNENKRQYAETIDCATDEGQAVTMLGTSKKLAVGASSTCFPESLLHSIYGTTSAMTPGSLEWKRFHSPTNNNFHSHTFTNFDTTVPGTNRWFWLEGIWSNIEGFKMRCSFCYSNWEEYKTATRAETHKRSKLTMKSGHNYGNNPRRNELGARVHETNPDHMNILKWKISQWNEQIDAQAEYTEQRLRIYLRSNPPQLEWLFRTVYMAVKNNIPMQTAAKLIKLQKQNSLNFDDWERERQSITSIAHYIAFDMDLAMRKFILQKKPLCSVSVDGWRNSVGVEHLLTSMRFMAHGRLETWFLRSVPLEKEDHESVFNAMMEGVITLMETKAVDKEFEAWFKSSVVGFASDGANVMVGAKRSVFKKLQDFVGPRPLFQIHCMAHRLELILNDALKSENNAVDKLEAAMRFIRKQHTKGGGSFASYQAVGMQMHPPVVVKRMPKMHKIRWAAITAQGLHTALNDYPALHAWYDSHAELQVPQFEYLFTAEGKFWLHAAADLLETAGQLSQFLQNRDGEIYQISDRFESFLIELQRMQGEDYVPDKFLDIELSELADNVVVHYGPELLQSVSFSQTRADFRNYVIRVQQRFEARFPPDQLTLYKSLSALSFTNWPFELDELQSYGNDAISVLTKFMRPMVDQSGYQRFENEAIQQWQTFKTELIQFAGRDFAKNVNPLVMWQRILSGKNSDTVQLGPGCPVLGPAIAKVIECAIILPTSSAENERIAHALSIIDDGTISISASTANNRLFVQQNGPRWEDFDALSYGQRWAQRHQRSIPFSSISYEANEENTSPSYSDFASYLSQGRLF